MTTNPATCSRCRCPSLPLVPQGAVINQIKELLGVSIRISKKGEFLPGTYDRACSITGTPEAVEIAQRLIQQKIDAMHLA